MKNVESFYPLSPMQQGMLFHSLFEPHTGMYIELFSVKLKGRLNLQVFEQTWQWVTERHSILRTAFLWEGLKEPVQVVQEKVKLPFQVIDWRHLPVSEQDRQLDQFTKDERLAGFDLAKAPLMRLALIQTGDEEFHFVWTHHHILLDGWSIPLLLGEVLTSYAAFNQGREPANEPTRPFRDYIVWLKRQDLKQSESYWRSRLAGFTAPTPLVVAQIDKSGLTSTPEFTEIEIYLPATSTLALQNFARQQGLTLNTLVQGAWAVLLSRYSGEDEVVFGTTVSGRPPDLPGSERMLGLFINTLPVRLAVPPEEKLLPWLKNVQAQQAEMRQYEYTPLAHIQGWSDVGRGVSLFDSILVFENFPLSGLGRDGTGGLEIEAGVSASHTNFPLTVVAAPGPQLSIKISYNRQLFDQDTIRRMLTHLQVILDGMAANPNIMLSHLPLLSAGERTQLLDEWNVRQKRFPETRCIHEWVEAQVERTPQASAVTFEGHSLSYAELNQRANALAFYLRSLGVGPESLVGIFMERNLDLIVAILGILKAGAAYVPLDPAYPVERLAFLVEDYSRAQLGVSSEPLRSVLISQAAMLASLPDTSAQVVCIDRDWQQIVAQAAQVNGDPSFTANPDSGAGPQNLAYVIYTSGSTGKPKGCMITHANVVRLFEATDDWYHFDENDVWTLFHSYAFDFSVWEIWGAFFYGGRLVIVPYMVSRSPDLFYKLLVDEEVTVLNQTPSAFRQLMRAEEAAGVSPDLKLRLVIFGGEALELQSLKPWFERHGDQRPLLVNMYGITETTVHVTYRPIYLQDLETAPGSVIGRAIPDLQVYILDQHFEPVPIGVPGELFVGGAGVARGYLNRPELTDQRFVKNLFERMGEERVYRSGDLARYLPNGDIEYLGRIDHQVKIRGFRIELGEIESVLVQHPQVREAVVLSREEERHKRLIAYIVPKVEHLAGQDGPGLQVAELRQFLSPILPDYMVPSAFVALESFPLTTNGKIDRKALLAVEVLEETKLATGRQYLPPQTPLEGRLADIWSSLLGVEKVGLLDNFFELGGDSILSIQFVSRAKQAGFPISYRQLFEHPVLKDLAAAISLGEILEHEQSLVTGPVPLTPVQSWFFEHHAAAPNHFNTSILFEVWQPLDVDLLKETLRRLLVHHDALRLAFHHSDGIWSQTNEEVREEIPFFEFDISQMAAGDQSAWIETKATELQGSFDLSRQPLLRIGYFFLGHQQPSRLLVTFHHLVTDGVSIRIFMEDFQTVYLQLLAGSQVSLPSKTTSYQTWARVLGEYSQSHELYHELSYWEAIHSSKTGGLPLDKPAGENTYGSTRDITLSLTTEDTRVLLHDLPMQTGARLQDALLAALLRWYRGLTGQQDLVIEMEGHGREQIPGTALEDADCTRTIGWFTSIFPFHLDWQTSENLQEELLEVRRKLEAIPNRGIGYGVLRYLTPDDSIHQKLRAASQPEINFNYLGLFDQLGSELPEAPPAGTGQPEDAGQQTPFRIAHESGGPEQDPNSPKSALIYLVAVVNGGQLGLRWLYSDQLHHSGTIQGWADSYLDQLKHIIQNIRELTLQKE